MKGSGQTPRSWVIFSRKFRKGIPWQWSQPSHTQKTLTLSHKFTTPTNKYEMGWQLNGRKKQKGKAHDGPSAEAPTLPFWSVGGVRRYNIARTRHKNWSTEPITTTTEFRLRLVLMLELRLGSRFVARAKKLPTLAASWGKLVRTCTSSFFAFTSFYLSSIQTWLFVGVASATRGQQLGAFYHITAKFSHKLPNFPVRLGGITNCYHSQYWLN